MPFGCFYTDLNQNEKLTAIRDVAVAAQAYRMRIHRGPMALSRQFDAKEGRLHRPTAARGRRLGSYVIMKRPGL